MQRILHFLAYFFINAGCLAQQYPFVHYTPKDGLVNSRVRKAYQDSKGRMYFLTYGGLSVFDGARFKNYTVQNSLLTGLVNDIIEIGTDSLLLGLNTCGLNLLVRGQMKKITIKGAHCPVVNNILKSNDGNIYIAADDGLYKYHWTQSKFEKLSTQIPGQNQIAMFAGAFEEYRDFIVFGANDLKFYKGLFLYNKRTNSITDTWDDETIYSLKSDRHGLIWISTQTRMGNLDTASLVAGKLLLRKPYAPWIPFNQLLPGSIVFNRYNEPIVSTFNKGIIRYRKNGTLLNIDPPELSGLTGYGLFSDREDVLWICHDGNGVYKLPNTKLRAVTNYFNETKSGIKTLRSITPDTCWIATNNNRLILHTRRENKTFNIIPSLAINNLHYSDNYLHAVDLRSFYTATLPKDYEKTIRFKKIFSLSDSANFGTLFVTDPYNNYIFFESKYICVLQKDKVIFRYPVYALDLIEGMYIDHKNLLWMVSRGNGLEVFSIHPDTPARYLQKKYQFIKELERASPRCMVVDQDEMFWIGTRNDGVMVFEFKNNRLEKRHHFHTQNGLTDNFVTALTCDRNNNIIVGTQTGLDRLTKTNDNNYRIENVTKSNNVFAYISKVWTDADSNVFAITNTGVVYHVEPVQNNPGGNEPQLLIEEMKVNGKTITPDAVPVRLKYYQRNISFSLAAPTFIDEKQVTYSYLLKGDGNNKWSDTLTNADISLLNLSPGNYTLHVQSFFQSTSYTPKEITFSFSILPPWWFRMVTGFSIIGLLIIGFRYYYLRKFEKQKTRMEKKQAIEKERTRIATDMHDDLGAGLSRIKFLSETIGLKKQQQIPIDEDISKIREYSHEMIEKMGEIVWALNEKNDTLSDLLSYTRSYAMEYLLQNGIDCTVDAPGVFPSDFVTGEFRRNIFLTVKEALHNVVKHAQASLVSIAITIDNRLSLEIKDNGIGIDKENIRPYSNGITNMEKRIKEIGGEFEIINHNGVLVKISVSLTGALPHAVDHDRE